MRTSRKTALLNGSASLVIMSMLLVPAFAQDSTDSDNLETVVVSGIRSSLESAQSIKQTSDQVVDSITATDIGALPDRNVAEALQRVPGVTLQRTDAANDPTRYGSTGNSVFVRGLSWVKSLMNGRDEFSAVDGRTLSFADVSSDLLSGVDVYKNPTAKMIEGGVGGTIDLKTRKPFDQDGHLFAVSADYTYGTLSDRALPSINGLYSDRWNTKIGEVGLLVSVDWQDQITRTEGINLGAYDCWDTSTGAHYDANDDGYDSCNSLSTGDDGSKVMGPDNWGWRQMEFRQQRLATNVVLQWRPNEQWEVTLSALNTYAHKTDMEHYVSLVTTSSTTDIGYMDSADYDSKGNWTGGTASLSSIDTRAGTGHNRNSDLSLNIKYTPNDHWAFSTDFQFVEASSPYRSVTMYTALNSTQEFNLDISGNTPKISWSDDSGVMSNAENYQWNAAMDYMRYNVAHSETARGDATYTFGGTGLFNYIKSVDFGFRTEQKLAVTRETSYNWGAICPTSWGGSYSGCPTLGGTVAEDYTAADGTTVTSGSDAVSTVNNYAEYFSFAKIFGNSLPGLYLPKSTLTAMNTLKSYKILSSIEPEDAGSLQNYARWISYAAEAGCSGDDMTCLALYENTDGNNSTSNRITKQKQATYAGYIQVNYVHENFLNSGMAIDGNFGVRVVETVNDISDGKLVMPTLNNTSCAVGSVINEDKSIYTESCDQFETAVEYLGGVGYAGATVDRPGVSNKYTNVLPSFNFRVFLTDQLQSRFAFSESIVRPDFSYTRNNATLSFNWGDSGTAEQYEFSSDPSGNGGNPDLKPMKAFNYDASLEWYFSPTGSVTLSLFYKDLKDYIFSSTTTTTITNPNSAESMDFNYTTYVNGDHGKVQGFELAYQQFYDMLPSPFDGIGLQANYTKIYNSGGHNGAVDVSSDTAVANGNNKDLPLEGMSEDSYNLAVMYAKYGVDFRLAYNWRSGYLLSSSGANVNQPVWSEDYGQLDGSLFYTFLEHYKVGIQVTNILGTSVYTDVGYADYHPRVNWIDVDRKITFAVRTNW